MAESQGVAELRGKYDDLVERIHGVDYVSANWAVT